MSCIQPVKLRDPVSPLRVPRIGSLPGTSTSVIFSSSTQRTFPLPVHASH